MTLKPAGERGGVRIAVTRQISRSFADCELTHLERRPICMATAQREHEQYRAVLAALGWVNVHLPALDDDPDAVFVEDVAVVLDEAAVMLRPGAASRRGETESVARALRTVGGRPLEFLTEPATMDGGDVLRVGRRIWVGLSTRTNRAGLEQFRAIAEPLGYDVIGCAVERCLHLKSAATCADEGTVVVNERWIDPSVFDGLRVIAADPSEPGGANVLNAGEGRLIVSAESPRTRRSLEQRGFACHTVATTQVALAEGAMTCCSLMFETRPM